MPDIKNCEELVYMLAWALYHTETLKTGAHKSVCKIISFRRFKNLLLAFYLYKHDFVL